MRGMIIPAHEAGDPHGSTFKGLGCTREHLLADVGTREAPITADFSPCFHFSQEQLTNMNLVGPVALRVLACLTCHTLD